MKAALASHKECYYPASVHTSYYSCHQYMNHIWLKIMNETDKELWYKNKNKKGGGSHEILINKIAFYLKCNNFDHRRFNTKIAQLKRLRVRADYCDREIDLRNSKYSLELSEIILTELKKC